MPSQLSDDERQIVAHLISGAIAELAFAECQASGGHARVTERLALVESIMRGDHRPRLRRPRRRREPLTPPEPIGGATETP